MEETNETIPPEIKYITLAEWKMLQLLDALPEWTVFDNVGPNVLRGLKGYIYCYDPGWDCYLISQFYGFSDKNKPINYTVVKHRFTDLNHLKKETGFNL